MARGVGLGIFVGFACPLGTHLIIGLPLAFLLRANKFLMILFTMLANPYTIAFFYPAQCWLGGHLLGEPVSLSLVEAELKKLLTEPSWANFSILEHSALMPLVVGGIVFGLISGSAGYFASCGMIQRYRLRKEAKLRKRLSVYSKRDKTLGIPLDRD